MAAQRAHSRSGSTERRKASTPQVERAALHEIARALGSAWDLERSLEAISRATAGVMGMDSCSLYLLDPSRQALILKASTGLAPAAVGQARLELGEGITGFAAQHGQPVAVRDAARDPRFKYLPQTQEQKFKSLLAVPLISQGQIIGAMNVQTTGYHNFTSREIALLLLISELAAGAFARAAQHDHLQRQVQELSTLAEVSRAVTAPIYLDEMLAVVVEMAAKIMGARASALLLVDRDTGKLAIRAAYGLSRAHAQTSVPVDNSLTGEVVRSGAPVVVRDLASEPLYRNRKYADEGGLRSFLAVPLTVRDNVIGSFNCYMGSIHDFSTKEIELFSTLANQTALALENANLAMNSMLVREMHHRIKNNLQMVAMLLRLQLNSGQKISARDVLYQTINRIMSIAAVHEALSQEGFKLIDMKGLIQEAAQATAQNMARPGQSIRVSVTGREFRLPAQPATTLAVATNELIQNALEHGFGERRRGRIQVDVAEDAASLILKVMDDGVGLPKGFAAKQNLGLQIVDALVREDLRGRFRLTANRGRRGTTATIIIPKRSLAVDSGTNAGAAG